jgi:hypothetical protein
VALLRRGLVRPRLIDRRGGLFGFVGEAAFLLGDRRQFLGVLFQRIDAAAIVDDFLAFVEQAFQVHLFPLLGATAPKLSATAPCALHCAGMAIQGGQNAVLSASPAVAVVAVKAEAELVISSVVV